MVEAFSGSRENESSYLHLERTEKLPMGSIKNVVSEPIEGHEEYHMMVSYHMITLRGVGGR